MKTSIQFRLLAGMLAVLTLLVGLFGSILLALTQNTLIQHFDHALLTTAEILSAVAEEEGWDETLNGKDISGDPFDNPKTTQPLELEFDVRMTPEFYRLEGGSYYQVYDATGQTLLRSPSLGVNNLDFMPATSTPVYRKMILPSGKRGRAIGLLILPVLENSAFSQGITLIVARNAEELYGFLDTFKWLLAGCMIGLSVPGGILIWSTTRKGLKPVRHLATRITKMDIDDLHSTFDPADYPVELHPVCRGLNDLMKRLNESFMRERRFNADVAHELRTPLAGLQTVTEVALSRQRPAQEYRHALQESLEITRGLRKIVDALLAIARLDQASLTLQHQVIEFKSFLDKQWNWVADRARDRGLTFENHLEANLRFQTDPDLLAMMLANLLNNAVDYCDDKGKIDAVSSQDDSTVTLILSNTGCSLDHESARHVFEPFWRGDTARSAIGIHSGIGLTVVNKIADILHISPEVSISNGVFTMKLIFNKQDT